MAYQGFLIKVGDYIIPHKYIKFDSYQASMNGQDLDSYRDANGILHRQALPHTVPKVEFNTVPMMSQEAVNNIMSGIRRNFTDAVEKKASVTFFMPETDSYVTTDAYLVDIAFEPYLATSDMINYKPFRIAFIGY